LTGEEVCCRGISIIAPLPSLGVACSFAGKKKNHLPPAVNEFRLQVFLTCSILVLFLKFGGPVLRQEQISHPKGSG
jgi:hypothetical protein